MTSHSLRYLANCSMLFTEVPLLERPAAAKAAGFDAVEFWWPWPDQPVPGDAEVDAFVTAVQDAGVQLAGLNFFAGDLAGPDCGVLSIPSRAQQFRDNVEVTLGIGERLGTKAFNALYGNRVDDATPEAAGRPGGREPRVRGEGRRPPRRHRAGRAGQRPEALPAAHRRRRGRRGRPGPGHRDGQRRLPLRPVPPGQQRRRRRRGHRQPRRPGRPRPDRRRPGSRRARLRRPAARPLARRARAAGYAGYVGLEYKPTTTTVESLAWLPVERR